MTTRTNPDGSITHRIAEVALDVDMSLVLDVETHKGSASVYLAQRGDSGDMLGITARQALELGAAFVEAGRRALDAG